MTKSLANKTRLKERLYTFFMAEGTLIQNYLDEFNSIIFDLESLNVKIKDRTKRFCWLSGYPPPISTSRKFCYTVTIILYLLRIVRVT